MDSQLILRVTGMTCGGCENAVRRTIGRMPGVAVVEASHADSRVVVRFDDALSTSDAIRERIRALGFTVAEE